jgi:hypothetical protein
MQATTEVLVNGGTGTAAPMVIKATGTDPLPVDGSINSFGGIHFQHANAYTANKSVGITSSPGTFSETSAVGIYLETNGMGTAIRFGTTDGFASGAKQRMVIDHSGKVGLGITGPQAALDVGNNIAMWNSGNNQCLAKKFVAGVTGLSGGTVVVPSDTIDFGVRYATPTSEDPIGVVVSEGAIAKGADVWVGICGQVQVKIGSYTGIRGSVFGTADKNGANGATGLATLLDISAPVSTGHWGEIGHCMKNFATAGSTGIIILHFN